MCKHVVSAKEDSVCGYQLCKNGTAMLSELQTILQSTLIPKNSKLNRNKQTAPRLQLHYDRVIKVMHTLSYYNTVSFVQVRGPFTSE